MNKGKAVLGRGLESLIPRPEPTPPVLREVVAKTDDGVSENVISHIELDRIQTNPFQPRADFDPVALDELMRSIREKGVIQPITVRRIDNGFQLISGERRVRAARDAGLAQIPAYVIRVQSEEEMLELALIENLQREHLNPIEIAISYKRLIDECSYTQEQLADRVSKDRSTVANFLRLLKLPDSIRAAVRKGQLTSGHARALITIEDPALQMEMFQQIIEGDLSVREVERLVRSNGKKKKNRPSPAAKIHDSAVGSVEDRLRQILGTKVEVKPIHDGRGQILVEYYSPGDLERLIDLFAGLSERPN